MRRFVKKILKAGMLQAQASVQIKRGMRKTLAQTLMVRRMVTDPIFDDGFVLSYIYNLEIREDEEAREILMASLKAHEATRPHLPELVQVVWELEDKLAAIPR